MTRQWLVRLGICGLTLVTVRGVWIALDQPEVLTPTAQGPVATQTPTPEPTPSNEDWADVLFDPIESEGEAIQRAMDAYGSVGNPRSGVARLLKAKIANTWLRATTTRASVPGFLNDPELWSLYNGPSPEGADTPVWLVGLQVDPVTQRSVVLRNIVPTDPKEGAASGSGGSGVSSSDPSAIHTEVAYVFVAGTGLLDGLDAIGVDSQNNPDHRSLQSLAQLEPEELDIIVPTPVFAVSGTPSTPVK